MTEEIYLLLAFITLIVLLYKPVKKAVLSALDKNQSQVIGILQQAIDLKEEAKQLLAQKSQEHEAAKVQTEQIMLQAITESQYMLEDAVKYMEELCAMKVAAAIGGLKVNEHQILEDIKEQAVAQAVESIRAEVFQNLDREEQMMLLQSSMDKIKKTIH
jgi:F0F1-type ATP synthase membrane subunit b/b'